MLATDRAQRKTTPPSTCAVCVSRRPTSIRRRTAQDRQQRAGYRPAAGGGGCAQGPEGAAGCRAAPARPRRVWYPTLMKATLSRRTMYQTRHTFASNALAAGEKHLRGWRRCSEMLFSVYARFIPNRTRRDGSALGEPDGRLGRACGRTACGPERGLSDTPEILLRAARDATSINDGARFRKTWCRRGDSNPHTLAGT